MCATAFGAVFRATFQGDKDVAVKVLKQSAMLMDESALLDFQQEVETLQKVCPEDEDEDKKIDKENTV